MLYDIFLFNGEIDMMKLRLKELFPYVNRFILVEAEFTFSGIKKELVYNKLRYDEFDNYAIFYFPIRIDEIENLNMNSAWDRETFCRNRVGEYVLDMSFDNDIFMLSDIDEIPNLRLFDPHSHTYPISLIMYFYYYNFNFVNKSIWVGTVVFDGKFLKSNTLQQIRNNRYIYKKYDNYIAGWHLSYFMTPEKISEKIQAFSHQEFNKTEFINEENIRKRIEQGSDLFDRNNEVWINVNNDECLKNLILPENYQTIPNYWKKKNNNKKSIHYFKNKKCQ